MIDMAMKQVCIRLPDDVITGIENARQITTSDGETLTRSKSETIARLLRRALKAQP